MVRSTIEEIKRRKILENAIIDIINRNHYRYNEIAKYYGGPLSNDPDSMVNSFNVDDLIDIENNVIERGVNPQRDIMHKYVMKKAKIRIFK